MKLPKPQKEMRRRGEVTLSVHLYSFVKKTGADWEDFIDRYPTTKRTVQLLEKGFSCPTKATMDLVLQYFDIDYYDFLCYVSGPLAKKIAVINRLRKRTRLKIMQEKLAKSKLNSEF